MDVITPVMWKAWLFALGCSGSACPLGPVERSFPKSDDPARYAAHLAAHVERREAQFGP